MAARCPREEFQRRPEETAEGQPDKEADQCDPAGVYNVNLPEPAVDVEETIGPAPGSVADATVPVF
ncbi:MAG: hypothetical protein ACREIF_15820 [Chthoniobacterales bacterium]